MKEKLRIGIIGVGHTGATLTRHFTRPGYNMVGAKSRGLARLAELAREGKKL